MQIFRKERISRINFWNQETKEGVSFVLNVQIAEQEEKSEAFWNTGSLYCSGEGL